MHPRAPAGQGGGETTNKPAQILVRECLRGVDERRLRGHPSPQAGAAVIAVDAGDRVDADLSLSCVTGADATASDRHRPLQIRRIQAEPVDYRRTQSGLLE